MSSWEKAATPTPSRPVQANVETSALSSGVCGVGRAMDVPWDKARERQKRRIFASDRMRFSEGW